MDKLNLETKTTDELFPDMNDLNDSINSLSMLPDDYVGKPKISKWLAILRDMEASDEITDEQVRQMLFDLQTSYDAFNKLLQQSQKIKERMVQNRLCAHLSYEICYFQMFRKF